MPYLKSIKILFNVVIHKDKKHNFDESVKLVLWKFQPVQRHYPNEKDLPHRDITLEQREDKNWTGIGFCFTYHVIGWPRTYKLVNFVIKQFGHVVCKGYDNNTLTVDDSSPYTYAYIHAINFSLPFTWCIDARLGTNASTSRSLGTACTAVAYEQHLILYQDPKNWDRCRSSVAGKP